MSKSMHLILFENRKYIFVFEKHSKSFEIDEFSNAKHTTTKIKSKCHRKLASGNTHIFETTHRKTTATYRFWLLSCRLSISFFFF